MVGGEQAYRKICQEDGLFMDLEGEEKKGKGRVDLKWGERERERERENNILPLTNFRFLFSPKLKESCRELAFEVTQWRMAAVQQVSQQDSG